MEVWKRTSMNGKEHNIFFPVRTESSNFISLCTDKIKALHSLEICTKVSCCTDFTLDLATDKQEIALISKLRMQRSISCLHKALHGPLLLHIFLSSGMKPQRRGAENSLHTEFQLFSPANGFVQRNTPIGFLLPFSV